MSYLDDRTNEMLQQGLAKAPTGFRDGVMRDIASYERERTTAVAIDQSVPRVPWWQWALLTVGSVVGGGQVVRFIFSVWFVTSAAY